jgi:hypothetical protein
MSLSLSINNSIWTKHLQNTLTSFKTNNSSLIPVIKGNGYGIGRQNLAKKCKELNINEVAVGSIFEASSVLKQGISKVLIMDPIKDIDKNAFLELQQLDNSKLMITISDIKDVSNIAKTPVIIEGLTSMNRFGVAASELDALANLNIQGISLHLPIDKSSVNKIAEVMKWIEVYKIKLKSAPKVIYLSHLSPNDVAELAHKYSDFDFKLRLGTKFWIGNLKAFDIKSTVLEVHDLNNETFGYRQRKMKGNSVLVVVSGGTSHGIGLQAPRANTKLKSRLVSVLSGILEAFNFSLSPFVINGKQRWFAESPHMNVSLLKLPKSVNLLKIGSEINVRVRMTTTNFDAVVIN